MKLKIQRVSVLKLNCTILQQFTLKQIFNNNTIWVAVFVIVVFTLQENFRDRHHYASDYNYLIQTKLFRFKLSRLRLYRFKLNFRRLFKKTNPFNWEISLEFVVCKYGSLIYINTNSQFKNKFKNDLKKDSKPHEN